MGGVGDRQRAPLAGCSLHFWLFCISSGLLVVMKNLVFFFTLLRSSDPFVNMFAKFDDFSLLGVVSLVKYRWSRSKSCRLIKLDILWYSFCGMRSHQISGSRYTVRFGFKGRVRQLYIFWQNQFNSMFYVYLSVDIIIILYLLSWYLIKSTPTVIYFCIISENA